MSSPSYCVLVCTYNRSRDLREMIASATRQRLSAGVEMEILVVDNNSSDETATVVQEFVKHDSRVRYVFEPAQGKSFALNTGLRVMRSGIFSVIDDDLVMPEDFVQRLHNSFASQPWAHYIGGKVLPLFSGPVPAWLTPARWAPIAMADYGDAPFRVDVERPVCLLSCSFRRGAVESVGGYRTDLSVNGTAIGGTEDSDLLARLWGKGFAGYYDPSLRLLHKVSEARVTRAHYRHWHFGHGRFTARSGTTPPGRTQLLGVPAYMVREAAVDVGRLVTKLTDMDTRIAAVDRLSFFLGFVTERIFRRG
jgi:glucosyl-dolichyl phosphate glucuronosyltransferase